jgi:hypothetical protein
LLKKWGHGGMVDTTDLKSVSFITLGVQIPLPLEEKDILFINSDF